MKTDSEHRRELIGLFDFDGTLIGGDSFLRFGVYAVGKVGFVIAMIKAMPWLLAWKLRRMSSSVAKERLFGFLFKGMEKSEFDRKGVGFATEIDGLLRHKVFREMEALRDAGGRIVIATASVEEWIRPWAVRYGVEMVVGTKVDVGHDGRLTGRFSTRNCRGEEKVRRIKEYLAGKPDAAATEDVIQTKFEIHAWGNLPDDRAMLAMAFRPHPV